MGKPNLLSHQQKDYYQQKGYCFPIAVLEEREVARFRNNFDDYCLKNADQVAALPPRDQHIVFSETHSYLKWVYEIVSHTKVLDAVECVLGPNLLVWNTRWFAKMPGDKTYISWHQDATYWGLHPPKVATAWVALSESVPENGCMRLLPGSHHGALLPQRETYAADNALSRGQEIAVEVDETKAVDVCLRPGEMSLHDIGLVHGSNVNRSDGPRIGLAIRYIAPEVVQEGTARQIAFLVRGKDEYSHFDPGEPPTSNSPTGGMHSEAVKRMLKNLMPAGYTVPGVSGKHEEG